MVRERSSARWSERAVAAVVVVAGLAFLAGYVLWLKYLLGNPPINDAVMDASFAVPYPFGVLVYMIATTVFFVLLPLGVAAGLGAAVLRLARTR